MCLILTLYVVCFYCSASSCHAGAECIVARRVTMPHSLRRLLLASISAFLVLLCTGVLVFSGWTSAHAASNLVTNSGFETGNLSGWTCDAGDAVVTSPVH